MFAGAGSIRFEDRGWDLELRDDTAPWAVDWDLKLGLGTDLDGTSTGGRDLELMVGNWGTDSELGTGPGGWDLKPRPGFGTGGYFGRNFGREQDLEVWNGQLSTKYIPYRGSVPGSG